MFLQINTATNETPHRAPRRTRNSLRMRTKLLRSTEKPAAAARVGTLENLNHWAESRVKWSILMTDGKSWKYLSFKAASDRALVKRWQWPYLSWMVLPRCALKTHAPRVYAGLKLCRGGVARRESGRSSPFSSDGWVRWNLPVKHKKMPMSRMISPPNFTE